jgi:hypothetical protein
MEVPMSKKAAVLIVVFGMIGAVNAVNLVVNGDFEQLPGGTGWTQWWGGNSNRYVTDPVEGDHCAGVWWHDDGIIQTLTVGPGKYEFGGKLMTTQGMVNRRGVIQVEFGGFIRQLDIVPAMLSMSGMSPAAGGYSRFFDRQYHHARRECGYD